MREYKVSYLVVKMNKKNQYKNQTILANLKFPIKL